MSSIGTVDRKNKSVRCSVSHQLQNVVEQSSTFNWERRTRLVSCFYHGQIRHSPPGCTFGWRGITHFSRLTSGWEALPENQLSHPSLLQSRSLVSNTGDFPRLIPLLGFHLWNRSRERLSQPFLPLHSQQAGLANRENRAK